MWLMSPVALMGSVELVKPNVTGLLECDRWLVSPVIFQVLPPRSKTLFIVLRLMGMSDKSKQITRSAGLQRNQTDDKVAAKENSIHIIKLAAQELTGETPSEPCHLNPKKEM